MADRLQHQFDLPVFMPFVYKKVVVRYQRYRNQSKAKMDALVKKHSEDLSPYLEWLAERSLVASGDRALAYLYDIGLANEPVQEGIREKFDPSG